MKALHLIQKRRIQADRRRAPAVRNRTLADCRQHGLLASEDHLLPLMGVPGDDRGTRLFVDKAMDVVMASYKFGT